MSTSSPLSEPCVDFSSRVEQADRFLASWKKLLEEHLSAELCQLPYCKTSFFRRGHKLTVQPDTLLLTPKPGFGWFDDGGQANLTQRHADITLRCEQNFPGSVE